MVTPELVVFGGILVFLSAINYTYTHHAETTTTKRWFVAHFEFMCGAGLFTLAAPVNIFSTTETTLMVVAAIIAVYGVLQVIVRLFGGWVTARLEDVKVTSSSSTFASKK